MAFASLLMTARGPLLKIGNVRGASAVGGIASVPSVNMAKVMAVDRRPSGDGRKHRSLAEIGTGGAARTKEDRFSPLRIEARAAGFRLNPVTVYDREARSFDLLPTSGTSTTNEAPPPLTNQIPAPSRRLLTTVRSQRRFNRSFIAH
jgi:hypothetical protein